MDPGVKVLDAEGLGEAVATAMARRVSRQERRLCADLCHLVVTEVYDDRVILAFQTVTLFSLFLHTISEIALILGDRGDSRQHLIVREDDRATAGQGLSPSLCAHVR